MPEGYTYGKNQPMPKANLSKIHKKMCCVKGLMNIIEFTQTFFKLANILQYLFVSYMSSKEG